MQTVETLVLPPRQVTAEDVVRKADRYGTASGRAIMAEYSNDCMCSGGTAAYWFRTADRRRAALRRLATALAATRG